MTTFNTTALYFCDTDAEFRTLIGHFRSSLGTAWAQDSDTGQINPATVTYPGANNSTAGFEIWHLDDSLHGTTPIYMKVEYGRGTAAGAFRVLVSYSLTGTNGAGTLQNGSGALTLNLSSAPSTRLVTDATNYNIFASGGSGRFGAVWWPDVQAAPFGRMFFLERFRDSDGTPNGNGFFFYYVPFHGDGANTLSSNLTWRKGALYTPSYLTPSNLITVMGARTHFMSTIRDEADPFSTLHEGKVWAAPFYPRAFGEKYPFTQVLLCSIHDFPQDFSDVTLSMYGANITFKPMGPFANDINMVSNGTPGSPIGMLLRYE